MKIFKKALAMLLALCTIVPFAACGKGNGGGGDTVKLTVYRARSSGMTDGDRDTAVKKAIEDKFYKDTQNQNRVGRTTLHQHANQRYRCRKLW